MDESWIQGGAVTVLGGSFFYLIRWVTTKLNGSLEKIHESNHKVADAVENNTEAVKSLTEMVAANTDAQPTKRKRSAA